MSLSVFKFDSLEVRTVVGEDGQPWFVAADVCAALGHSNPSKAVDDHVHEEDKSNHSLGLPGKAPLTINESGLYALIFGSRLETAQRFKKWVTAEVLPSIRKTGSYAMPSAPAGNKAAQDLEALEVLARFLNVAPSGKITMARAYLEHAAPSLLPALPGYAIDAPPSVLVSGNGGSSMVTASATELLKRHGVKLSAAKFNELLADAGLLNRCQRTSSRGTFKHFWAVTPHGERYGKNVTSAHNARETQPHWFVDCFGDLLEVVGVSA